MADYTSISEFAPTNYTGSLSASLIEAVPNNPAHTGAHAVQFPTYYDEYINKTEGRVDAPISVIAEKYELNDIVYEGGNAFLYLHHSPMESLGGSIQLSEGTIETGYTDYGLGIIKFTTVPTADFYINYLARADSFAGEHINSLQNAIMVMQRMFGAGSTAGEGLRNAEIWLDEYPASLQSILPNGIYTKALDKDVQIKGNETGSFGITIGNGADVVTVDAAEFKFTSTDVSQAISGQIGDDFDDVLVINSLVHIASTGGSALGPTGTYNHVALMVGDPLNSIWTGVADDSGPYALPYADTGNYPLAQFNGDVLVVGDVFITGAFVVAASSVGQQVSSINETLAIGIDLRVTGNSILGTDVTKTVDVGGTLDVGRYIHVQGLSNDVSRFDTAIWFKNQGNVNNGLGGPYADGVVSRQTKWLAELPFHLSNSTYITPGSNTDLTVNKVSHVDGLDPSYIAKNIVYRAHNRSDFKNNMINVGVYEGRSGEVGVVSAPGTSLWEDTGMEWPTASISAWSTSGFTGVVNNLGEHTFRWHHMGGDYYHGKFGNESYTIASGEYAGDYCYGDGNQWIVLWTNNDSSQAINPGAMKFGARVPIDKITVDYHSSSPYIVTGASVQLSRAFNTTVTVGDTYNLYHPRNSKPNAIQKTAATTFDVKASQAEPLVATIDGITKILTTDCSQSITSSYTGTQYVVLEGRTPETAKQNAGYLLETEPGVVLKTSPIVDDSQVLIGEFHSEDPGAGISGASVITYRYNCEYDTLWMRTQSTNNLYANNTTEFCYRADVMGITADSTGSIEAPAQFAMDTNFGDILSSDANEFKMRIQHNFGSLERAMNADLRLYAAPNLGESHDGHGLSTFREGPDYAYSRELENVKYDVNTGYSCYEVLQVTRNYTDVLLYELDDIPRGIIGARAANGERDLALTGSFGEKDLMSAGVDERERRWWWIRATMS